MAGPAVWQSSWRGRLQRGGMNQTGEAATPTFEVDPDWLVFGCTYPTCSLLFWALYFFVWDRVSPLCLSLRSRKVYGNHSTLQRMCWKANCNSCVHAFVVVALLVAALGSDAALREPDLHPHDSVLGHTAMSFSLSYFTFAIPWQHRLYFCKKERHAVTTALVIHHLVVVVGILAYLLSSVCALYGAVAFACMEFTNCFFVPYTMMCAPRHPVTSPSVRAASPQVPRAAHRHTHSHADTLTHVRPHPVTRTRTHRRRPAHYPFRAQRPKGPKSAWRIGRRSPWSERCWCCRSSCAESASARG